MELLSPVCRVAMLQSRRRPWITPQNADDGRGPRYDGGNTRERTAQTRSTGSAREREHRTEMRAQGELSAPPRAPQRAARDRRPNDVTGAREGLDRRIADRFEQVAIASARFAAWGRTAAVVVVGLWLALSIPAPRVYYYELLLAVFIVVGWVNFRVSLRMGSEHWLIFVFAFVDMGLLTFAILSENPFEEVPLPVALHFRFDGFVFFFLLFAGVLHSYSPRLVLWSGVSMAFWWAGALALSVQAPGS